jgi:hypothetical protein
MSPPPDCQRWRARRARPSARRGRPGAHGLFVTKRAAGSMTTSPSPPIRWGAQSPPTQLRGRAMPNANRGRSVGLLKVFSHFVRLTVRPLSQARRLGSLRLPHRYLSGTAISPPVCIRRQLRPNGSGAHLYGPRRYGLAPFPHSSVTLSRRTRYSHSSSRRARFCRTHSSPWACRICPRQRWRGR